MRLTRTVCLFLASLLFFIPPFMAVAENGSSKRFGDYEVHYSLFNSSFITPEIAAAHSITRSKSTALMNISVLKKQPDGSWGSIPATVTGSQYDLIRTEALEFTEIRERDAVYYLSNFAITDKTTIYFTVLVEAEPGQKPFKLEFSKLLYKDE